MLVSNSSVMSLSSTNSMSGFCLVSLFFCSCVLVSCIPFQCPKQHERSSTTDLTLMPEPTTDIEPEPTSAMEHVQELPPSMVPETANAPVQEVELEATSVPRTEPITRSIPESSPEPAEEHWLVIFLMQPAPNLVPTTISISGDLLDDPLPSCHLPTSFSPSPLVPSSFQGSPAPLVLYSSSAPPLPQSPTNSPTLPRVSTIQIP